MVDFKAMWAACTNLVNNWKAAKANQYIVSWIPPERTTNPAPPQGEEAEPQQLKAYEHYFRIWLSDMFLTKSRIWFQTQYPMVQSSVSLNYGDQKGAVLTHVAAPPSNVAGKGVLLDYRLTDLLPFNGGVVEIATLLQALNGQNYLNSAIEILNDFSKLIAVPIMPALTIAEKVSSGISKLTGSTNGSTHLAFHESLVSGGGGNNPLRTGFVAVLLAPVGTLNEKDLSVNLGRLEYKNAAMTDYDYMLLRIEGRTKRDDWRLHEIDDAIKKARTAILQGKDEDAKGYRAAALIAAYTSPDLAEKDRSRVARSIKEDLAEVEDTHKNGLAPKKERDLTEIVKTWGATAEAREPISLEKLLAD